MAIVAGHQAHEISKEWHMSNLARIFIISKKSNTTEDRTFAKQQANMVLIKPLQQNAKQIVTS